MINSTFSSRRAAWAGIVIAVCCLVPVAGNAQTGSRNSGGSQSGNAPISETVSDLQVRVLSLEQTVAQLTGQIEELRFKNAQMAKQLQQVQDDLSLRVAALEQASGRPPAVAAPAAAAPAAPVPAPAVAGPMAAAPVYDPNAPLSQPVAKQPESSSLPPAPSATAPTAAAAPLVDGQSGFVIRTDASGKVLPPDPKAASAPPPAAAAPTAPPVIKAPPPPAAVGSDSVASVGTSAKVALPPGTPKQQYDFATGYIFRQDYASAEAALRAFLKANPNDPLAANAQYWIGESFYARGDYQQAAVEYMTGYQNYRKSAKGPDNLLKMGMSLERMRKVSEACIAFNSIPKEYPDADDKIRKDAQSERAKLKCP
ncbi:MAG: tol-pal system protein YbgF [Rhodospirillaceae bacterium]|nr:MAG: tol-pal system protein YbgF [Rhodospirillaceae bacterium]